ncbi:hypothetical protein V5N11_009227 [Cardamine amara subsp. amara]|uniref:Transmembrane protein n=1 Tax=Cardamine amara subsp. amara TaxID=228776 RepID=A0ABD1AA02_CARAN
MASLTNNNSSSSPPIPNRPNPKPRNSEVCDPLRRSFKGSPFPANSKVNLASDFSRRNSFGGDKENENKAVLTPKGSKNFMLPTISAVSKINASPRKKVLSDKNEMSRSFSDVKGLILEDTKSHHHRAKSCVSFSDVIHTICIDEKKHFEESHDMTVTDYVENEGITYSDPRFRISPRPSVPYTSPEFAASEVNTLLPPYDPNKNYLSPRPQFLHYKPNPRVEKRFDECKQLEELFISESSSSDTELSVEESENCAEQEKDVAEAVVEEETEDVKKRFDERKQLDELLISESFSSETELSVEESEKCEERVKYGADAGVEEETEDVEQLEAESDDKEMVSESIEETSQVPKQSGFRKLRFFVWFLALALGFMLVSATLSPPAEPRFYKFHIPREITEFAKANNLEQWSEKLWTLTESSLVYIDKLISSLGGEETEYGPLQFHNLTYTLEDETVFHPISVEINEEPLPEKMIGQNNLEDGSGEDGSVNEFEEESGIEENSEVVCETKDGVAETNEFDEQTEMKPGTDIELNEDEGNLKVLSEDGVEWNIEEQRESEVNPEENYDARVSESQEKLETGSSEKESEAIYINQHDVESAVINVHQQKQSGIDDAESGLEEGFGEIAAETSNDLYLKGGSSNKADNDLTKAVSGSGSEGGLEEIAAATSDDLHHKVRSSNKTDNGSSAKAMIVFSSTTMLVLLAAVAFIYSKKPRPVAAATPEPTPKTNENLMKGKLSSLNFEEDVDDRISYSFSKKSSLHKDPQSGGGKKSNNSSSSKLRRESMATSASEYSVGSFSYGSFTTYEKIPIKTGDREEEMVTPVRRSSRIRNKL